jgi:hypothetical protein
VRALEKYNFEEEHPHLSHSLRSLDILSLKAEGEEPDGDRDQAGRGRRLSVGGLARCECAEAVGSGARLTVVEPKN